MTTAPHWLERALHNHVKLAAITTLASVSTWSLLPEHGLWLQAALMLALISTLGLPHGALDHIAGRALFAPRLGVLWPAAFGLIYLGMGALVVAGWLLAPGVWLCMMLAISAIHFGSDDSDSRLGSGPVRFMEIFGRGGAIIVIPSAVHPGQVAAIFAALLPDLSPDEVVPQVETATLWAAPPVMACLLYSALRHASQWLGGAPMADTHRDALLEILCISLIFIALPPLIAFTLYFCAWHSLRQILLVSAALDQIGPARALLAFGRQAFFPTAAVVLAGLFVWGAAGSSLGDRLSAAITVVFVSLFALTVPHHLFQEAYRRLGSGPGRTSENRKRLSARPAPDTG